MSTHYTFCPHEGESSKRKKIPFENPAPTIGARRYCPGCDRHCRVIGLKKDGDQILVITEPVYESRSIDPYLNPHLYDDVGLEDDEI